MSISDEVPVVIEQSAYPAWEQVREEVHARHRLVESGAYARCSCGVEFYWPERESQYEQHRDERLVAAVAARVRAEALREFAAGIAPNRVRPADVIVVGARMTEDVLALVRDVTDGLVAAVRAEAVAERNEHWQQRLDDVRAELERPIAHERKLRGELLRSLWRAVHDRSDAPDHYLISEDELLCAVQDMHREGQCSEAEAVVAAERQQMLAELHEQAQLLPTEEAQRTSTWLAKAFGVVAAGSVPVATPEHGDHDFAPGVDVDMAREGRPPDPRWCNNCGESMSGPVATPTEPAERHVCSEKPCRVEHHAWYGQLCTVPGCDEDWCTGAKQEPAASPVSAEQPEER